nr:aspartyl-phosphate phosphatase Spo0E family protein [Sporosarcina ureilytica]
MQKFILQKQINVTRKCMYVMAKHLGFTHPSVVSCSQRLDTLLNRYQEI